MASRAVRTRTGVASPLSRSLRHASNPSTMGIRTSSTIRSTGDRATASRASAPCTAVRTAYPAWRSARSRESRTSGSSSTTSSRPPPAAGASGGGAVADARVTGRVLLHLRVHAGVRLRGPAPGRAAPLLLAPVLFGRDPLPVLDGHLFPLPAADIALRQPDHRAQAIGHHGVHRVLPAVLPARDHAVLPGVPARADAAAADQGPPRPGHRRRHASPGDAHDRNALADPAAADGQIRSAGRADLPAVPYRLP